MAGVLMICSFCSAECIMEDCGFDSEIWMCHNHPYPVKELVSYTYHVLNQCEGPDCCPQKHHTATVITCGMFKAKFRHTTVPKFALYKTGASDPVFRLPFHPHLTPENIKEKLPLWITFS